MVNRLTKHPLIISINVKRIYIIFAVKHIKSVDGFQGCYRGLGPKVTGNLLSAIVTQTIIDYLAIERDEENFEEENEEERCVIF